MLIDNDKIRKDILVTAAELNYGFIADNLKLFLEHQLETLISLVDNSDDTSMYDLFDEDTLEYINKIYEGELL